MATPTPEPLIRLPDEEFLVLSREMEKYHAVFYKMWSLGKPYFDNLTDTAYVRFDSTGKCFHFGINPKYWATLSFVEKQFIICHECLHVILNHGNRINNALKNNDKDEFASNIAADIVVNELLLSQYGFNKEIFKNWKNFCFKDTVFKKNKNIPNNESFEYYFNLINKELDQIPNVPVLGNGQAEGQNVPQDGQSDIKDKTLIDDHKGFNKDPNNYNEAIEHLDKELTNEEKKDLKKIIESQEPTDKEAGTEAGFGWHFANVKIVKKRKWENIIKNWAKTKISKAAKNKEQWVRLNRRFFFMQNDNFILPTEMEIEEKEKDKINVWFFQDTSGSCSHLADRFFKAATSLPDNKFNVKLFCFDTKVYEVDIKEKKLYGFGGTSFNIISKYIDTHLKPKEKYPFVFVVTDGWGNTVDPAQPQKWHWFLSENYTYYIPPKSKIYNLKNFE
jgi:predicted metal-dependent peptidase